MGRTTSGAERAPRRQSGRQPKACIISLGCSKNQVDTEYLMGQLSRSDWSFTQREDEADLLLINTCSFLDAAVDESREAIEGALRWKDGRARRRVVVAGCLVNRFRSELESRYPGVDLLLRPGRISRFGSWLRSPPHLPAHTSGGTRSYLPGRTDRRGMTTAFWAYLKIADGCDNRCSYCLIPEIRGGHRSRAKTPILREARDLLGFGVRELNLVGQDITRWRGRARGSALPELLEALSRLHGEYRIRLLYLHPARIDDKLRRLLSRSRSIFPYLDMPIQHSAGRVLRSMNRPYTRRRLERVYRALREDVPGIALRTTVMVGHPGEGEDEFEELLGFLREFPFENLGAFTFSPQPGTRAADLPGRVDPEEAERRYHAVMQQQRRISTRLWRSRRGDTAEALVLRPLEEGADRWIGRTAWQAPEVDGEAVLRGRSRPGELVTVRITGSSEYDLEGAIVE